jgi:hypothetical protein
MRYPLKFYIATIKSHSLERKKKQKELLWSSIIRFVVFSISVLMIYLFHESTQSTIVITVIGLSLFLVLVKRHSRLKAETDKLSLLIAINQTEIDVINNNALDLETGDEFVNTAHPYSHDIDLF